MSGSDVLTLANQLTLLRMLLIPAFVVLVIEGELGWALVVFAAAGVTDALDGVIARRSGQKTTLGAWLDPMADKLMLVSAFVVLTLPGLGLANRLPIWLTALIISRDVCIVVTVAIRITKAVIMPTKLMPICHFCVRLTASLPPVTV